MSRVFDGVEVGGLAGVSVEGRWCAGARERRWTIPPGRQRVGGAVKAGPLGPPGGGALGAPGVQLSPATLGLDRPWAVLVAPWWLDTADLTIAQRLERGDRDARRPAIPSRRCSHGVFRPQSERAHSNRRPRHLGVGATAIFERACWLCPSLLKRPPGPGSGSRHLAARSRPS